MTRSYVPTRRDVSILLLESLATPATAAVSKPRRSEIERLRRYAGATHLRGRMAAADPAWRSGRDRLAAEADAHSEGRAVRRQVAPVEACTNISAAQAKRVRSDRRSSPMVVWLAACKRASCAGSHITRSSTIADWRAWIDRRTSRSSPRIRKSSTGRAARSHAAEKTRRPRGRDQRFELLTLAPISYPHRRLVRPEGSAAMRRSGLRWMYERDPLQDEREIPPEAPELHDARFRRSCHPVGRVHAPQATPEANPPLRIHRSGRAARRPRHSSADRASSESHRAVRFRTARESADAIS